MMRPTVVIAALVIVACTGEPDSETPLAVEQAPLPALAAVNERMEKPTDSGVFVVALQSAEQPVPLRRIHRWTLQIAGVDGAPVTGATVRVDGGMPAHNHGFPTEPRVTGEIAPGLYRVDGVRFSMSGAWRMQFAIAAGGRIDTVSFDFSVAP